MKASRLLFAILVLTVFAGPILAAPKTEKLRVGMTKEEVTKIMGKPLSAKTEGMYEFLTFKIGEKVHVRKPLAGADSPNRERGPSSRYYAPEVYTVLLHKGLLEFNCPGLVRISPRSKEPNRIISGTVSNLQPPTDGNTDNVRIVSFESSPTKIEGSVELKMKVAYTLKDENEGRIVIKIYCLKPQVYVAIGEHAVPKGSGELEIVAKITSEETAAWKEHEYFVKAILGNQITAPEAARFFGSAEQKITLTK